MSALSVSYLGPTPLTRFHAYFTQKERVCLDEVAHRWLDEEGGGSPDGSQPGSIRMPRGGLGGEGGRGIISRGRIKKRGKRAASPVKKEVGTESCGFKS